MRRFGRCAAVLLQLATWGASGGQRPEDAHDVPQGDALIPEAFDEHTIIFLVRPAEAPTFSDEALDRLQEEHLTYLRDLQRRGVLITNGPLSEQTDERMRGISVYAVPLADALELANADPMVRAGRLAIRGARWWTAAGTATFGAD